MSIADLPRTADVAPPPTYALEHFAGTARAIVRGVYDVEVVDQHHVPATGPVVVAANHTGWLDGPLMAIFAPRPLHALTKTEMFDGALGRFLSVAGQIPLDRFVTDVGAMRTAVRVLRDGGAVGIFPEGTRGAGDLTRARGGAAYLALVSGAPVVPLVMLGTRAPGSAASFPPRRTRMVLTYGPPIHLGHEPWPRRRSVVAEATETVRTALLALREEALDRTGLPAPGPIPGPDPDARPEAPKES